MPSSDRPSAFSESDRLPGPPSEPRALPTSNCLLALALSPWPLLSAPFCAWVGCLHRYGLLALVRSPSAQATALVCAVTLLQGAGIAVSMAVPAPLLAQYATPSTMGRMQAFATTTGTVGRVVGPVCLSLLFGFDPALPVELTALACLLGALGYFGVQLVEWQDARHQSAEEQEATRYRAF